MALATADASAQPSARIVLLKGHGPQGFVFYTNEESAKGREIAENPRATLLFHWKSLRRQVRIEGAVERVSDADADTYFATRTRDSQLGAWASDQSRPLDSRSTFEEGFEQVKGQFEGKDVPRPPHWRGYRVVPKRIEFWSDRPHRLHERRLFTLEDGRWSEGLLYP
jgi:pyridoxamine 5'-phosphate oxidase